MKNYLRYLWLKGVHYRRIIEFIGALEGSRQYRYIRGNCAAWYEKACATMPENLKDAGIDLIFRNEIIAPLYYHELYRIFKSGSDEVMNRRAARSMAGSTFFLFNRVVAAWGGKIYREAKLFVIDIVHLFHYLNRGISREKLAEGIAGADFNCILFSNRSLKVFSRLHDKLFANLSAHGCKPLFLSFGPQFSFTQKDCGYLLDIPHHTQLSCRYSDSDRRLLLETLAWVDGLDDIPGCVRRAVKKGIRNSFDRYLYARDVAAVLLPGTKCLLQVAENQLEYRTFLHLAQRADIETCLYYPPDGIHELIYDRYFSDTILVCNKIQQENFLKLGYPPDTVHVVGSVNFEDISFKPRGQHAGVYQVIYFTKMYKWIDEAILDDIVEKFDSLKISYQLVIKKHPKDMNSFARYQEKGAVVTAELDFWGLVEESDLVVSQYSGADRRIFPTGKPIIIYSYSDFLDWGQRGFFRRSQLPNYIRAVENSQEFSEAVDQFLEFTEAEPLPEQFASDLYGYPDSRCCDRVADIVFSSIND